MTCERISEVLIHRGTKTGTCREVYSLTLAPDLKLYMRVRACLRCFFISDTYTIFVLEIAELQHSPISTGQWNIGRIKFLGSTRVFYL